MFEEMNLETIEAYSSIEEISARKAFLEDEHLDVKTLDYLIDYEKNESVLEVLREIKKEKFPNSDKALETLEDFKPHLETVKKYDSILRSSSLPKLIVLSALNNLSEIDSPKNIIEAFKSDLFLGARILESVALTLNDDNFPLKDMKDGNSIKIGDITISQNSTDKYSISIGDLNATSNREKLLTNMRDAVCFQATDRLYEKDTGGPLSVKSTISNIDAAYSKKDKYNYAKYFQKRININELIEEVKSRLSIDIATLEEESDYSSYVEVIEGKGNARANDIKQDSILLKKENGKITLRNPNRKDIPNELFETFENNKSISNMELDSNSDLESVSRLLKEVETANIATDQPYTFKTRYLGRHNAYGLYYSSGRDEFGVQKDLNQVIVDIRYPFSFIHELSHHIDLTTNVKNRSALIRTLDSFNDYSGVKESKLSYFSDDKEVFARAGEVSYTLYQSGLGEIIRLLESQKNNNEKEIEQLRRKLNIDYDISEENFMDVLKANSKSTGLSKDLQYYMESSSIYFDIENRSLDELSFIYSSYQDILNYKEKIQVRDIENNIGMLSESNKKTSIYKRREGLQTYDLPLMLQVKEAIKSGVVDNITLDEMISDYLDMPRNNTRRVKYKDLFSKVMDQGHRVKHDVFAIDTFEKYKDPSSKPRYIANIHHKNDDFLSNPDRTKNFLLTVLRNNNVSLTGALDVSSISSLKTFFDANELVEVLNETKATNTGKFIRYGGLSNITSYAKESEPEEYEKSLAIFHKLDPQKIESGAHNLLGYLTDGNKQNASWALSKMGIETSYQNGNILDLEHTVENLDTWYAKADGFFDRTTEVRFKQAILKHAKKAKLNFMENNPIDKAFVSNLQNLRRAIFSKKDTQKVLKNADVALVDKTLLKYSESLAEKYDEEYIEANSYDSFKTNSFGLKRDSYKPTDSFIKEMEKHTNILEYRENKPTQAEESIKELDAEISTETKNTDIIDTQEQEAVIKETQVEKSIKAIPQKADYKSKVSNKVEEFLSVYSDNFFDFQPEYHDEVSKKLSKFMFNIEHAIENNMQIEIVGDYDGDGMASSAAMYLVALCSVQSMQLNENVYDADEMLSYVIKDRFSGGYGVDKDSIGNNKSTIIVDMGSNLVDMKDDNNLFVVDHHSDADFSNSSFVLNPSPKSSIDGKNVAISSGVIISTMHKQLMQNNSSYRKVIEKYPERDSAIGLYSMISAVSDMANTNSNEVREVIRKGIDASKEQVLQNSIPFLKNSPKNPLTGKSTIDEDVVGFQWNTLLNAIGRLGKEEKDVTLATEALLGNIVKKDYLSKEELAQNTDRLYRINDFLHSVNNKRKELQTQSFYRFEKRKKEQDKNIIQVQDFLVYFDERTPKGVTGLVASEIVQKSHTLNGSLVLTKSGHEKYSGSFRGGNLMPLFKELEKLDMVTNIGGHDYAGGISIEGDIDTFLTSMNNLISNGDFKFQRTDMAYRLGKVKSVKDIKNAIKSLKIETKINDSIVFELSKEDFKPAGLVSDLEKHDWVDIVLEDNTGDTVRYKMERKDAINITEYLESKDDSAENLFIDISSSSNYGFLKLSYTPEIRDFAKTVRASTEKNELLSSEVAVIENQIVTLEEDVVRENNIEKASVQDANIISVEIESSNFTGIFDSSDKELFELIDVNDTVVTIKHLDDNKEEKETSFVYFNGDIEPIELHHPFSIENLEDKSYANIIAPSQENDSTNENIIEDKEEIMTKTEEELEVIAEDTKKQKPLLISIYGSPGSGKTTLSFDIASAINKDSDMPSAEYIPEIARLMIMENKDNVKDQLKVSTTQFDLCKNAINTSDIVITDSPIELGLNFMNDAVDSEKQIVNDFINEGREYYRQNTHEVSIFLPIPAKEAFYDKDPNRITSYEQSELIAKKVKKKLDKENRSYVEFDRNKDNLKELIAQIKESWESTIDIDIENTTKAEISEEAKYIKEKVEAEMQKYSIAKNLDIEDSLNTALEKENTYLVAVGGSGSGKTHFASKLPIEKVVNATTREKREGEIEGVDYYYLNNEEFDNLDLLESTTFNGKKYGMPKDELDGKDNGVIVTGPSGVQNIKNYIENTLKAKTILVHFNIDKETRIENMKKRGDSMETIESRLQDDNIDEVVSEQLEVDITIDRLDNAYQRIVSYVLKQDSEVDSKLSDSLDVLIESDLLTKDDKEILLNIANREDVTQNARFTKGESFSLDDKASNKDLVKWLVYSKNLSVDELVTATSRLYQMDIDYSDVGIKVTFAEFKSIVVSDEYALKELLIEVIGNKSESTVEKSSLREILTSYDSIKTEENSSQGLFNLDVDYDRVDELKERIISPSIMQQ